MLNTISHLKLRTTLVLFFTVLCVITTMPGCMSAFDTGSTDTSSDTSSATHQYLYIPNASWYAGTPSYSPSQGGTGPTVTVKEGDEILTTGDSVTWEVSLEAIIEIEVDVSVVVITSGDLDGYFTYPITEEDIQNGYVDIEMNLEDSAPSEAICNRDYRGNGTCYEQADTGVTGADFAVANDVGGEMTLTVSATIDITITETVDTTDTGDSGTDGSSGGTSSDAICSDWVAYCSCSLRACSDGVNAWYDVGSGVYYCASPSNCTSAAQQATQWCTNGCY